jgi:hypothetical protein
MSSIVGPYANVESEYRRNRIAASFREHRKVVGRRHIARRRAAAEPTPAIDWFGE